MADTAPRVEDELLSVGRIDIQEAEAAAKEGRDIFAERVEKKITEILDKYGCILIVDRFHFVVGMGARGAIKVVRKPQSAR